ncbi:sensor histidine kinase [Wukongibacter sp. M2B1]|uniref:sensor histidine kinase n=1 Tax=Wukongibacter sp. M2B1 TaxID=3088895 RepID=UPI003D7A9F2B
MEGLFHLRDVIDVEVLQEIQDEYAEATGFAAITVDYRGNPITQYSNFSRFCKLIRQDKKCRDACHQSDAHGGLEAARTGKPSIYKCPMGLIDFAVPIIVKGQYLGSILSGQAKLKDNELVRLNNITRKIRDWTTKPEIMEAYEEIAVTSYDKVAAAAHMMFYMSNYIVEKGMVNLIQEELNNKNVKLLKEMKIRNELEKALKDAELQALQSQINPHFLFNVLNTIGRLSLIENAPKTQETVHSLAEMLRYTLKSKNEMVLLEDAILHVERYLKIQSVRFGDRIRFNIDISEGINQVKIPFMTLQPFIENAINHGLEPKEEGGTIKVTGYSLGDDLIIKINDDGVGIAEDELETILDSNKSNSTISNSMGIGISNVNRRLKYYYGSEFGIKIKSKVNEGTTVKIVIPKKVG